MPLPDPTNCQDCNADLSKVPYVFSYACHPDGSPKSVTGRCEPCSQSKDVAQYRKDKVIYTSMLTTATLDVHCAERGDMDRVQLPLEVAQEIAAAGDRIYKVVREFSERIWPDFRGQLDASPTKGMSGGNEDFKVLAFEMCGRGRIQIEDARKLGDPDTKFGSGGARVTVQYDATSKETCGGLHGIAATEEEAIALLNAAMRRWPTMRSDKGVGLGF